MFLARNDSRRLTNSSAMLNNTVIHTTCNPRSERNHKQRNKLVEQSRWKYYINMTPLPNSRSQHEQFGKKEIHHAVYNSKSCIFNMEIPIQTPNCDRESKH